MPRCFLGLVCLASIAVQAAGAVSSACSGLNPSQNGILLSTTIQLTFNGSLQMVPSAIADSLSAAGFCNPSTEQQANCSSSQGAECSVISIVWEAADAAVAQQQAAQVAAPSQAASMLPARLGLVLSTGEHVEVPMPTRGDMVSNSDCMAVALSVIQLALILRRMRLDVQG